MPGAPGRGLIELERYEEAGQIMDALQDATSGVGAPNPMAGYTAGALLARTGGRAASAALAKRAVEGFRAWGELWSLITSIMIATHLAIEQSDLRGAIDLVTEGLDTADHFDRPPLI